MDRNKDVYIKNLKEVVAIKSVSAWPHTRNDIDVMVKWTANRLKALGATVELADVGTQTLPDGKKLPLPKVILAQLGNVSKVVLYSIFWLGLCAHLSIVHIGRDFQSQ